MTDETPIQNALTDEEWARLGDRARTHHPIGNVVWLGTRDGVESHAMAALCLYQQPFGFDYSDVKLLRDEAESEWCGTAGMMETGQKLLALASRIAALLPPETP